MNEATTKALGQLIGQVISFVLDLVILKLGWNGLIVNLFPTLHLPAISWFQALLIYWICGALFKQRIVSIAGK